MIHTTLMSLRCFATLLLAATITTSANAQSTTTTAATGNTWMVGSTTYTADYVSPETWYDGPANVSKWKLSASSVVNDAKGNHMHAISFSFGTVAAPKPGKYRVVSITEDIKPDDVLITITDADPDADLTMYTSIGTAPTYISITVKDGMVSLVLPLTDAERNDGEKKVKLSAGSLTQTKAAGEE